MTGLDVRTAQTRISELGPDLRKGPTVKHCASWLGLAPPNETSGGKIRRRRPLPGCNRAAQSVGRTQTSLGAYSRRTRARKGPRAALTATAHKLARILYPLRSHRDPYQPPKPADYDQRMRQRELALRKRKAARLGFTLQPATA